MPRRRDVALEDLDRAAALGEVGAGDAVEQRLGVRVSRRLEYLVDGAGLDVVVPGNELAALEAEMEAGASFEESAVFRRATGGVVFLVFVLRDAERDVAALFPAFYPQRGESAEALAGRAHDAGELDVFIRPLDRDRVVTVTIDDPGLVFPPDRHEPTGE